MCAARGEFINLFLIAAAWCARDAHACPFAAHKAHRCAHKNQQIMRYIRSCRESQQWECLFFSLDRIPPHNFVLFCGAAE